MAQGTCPSECPSQPRPVVIVTQQRPPPGSSAAWTVSPPSWLRPALIRARFMPQVRSVCSWARAWNGQLASRRAWSVRVLLVPEVRQLTQAAKTRLEWLGRGPARALACPPVVARGAARPATGPLRMPGCACWRRAARTGRGRSDTGGVHQTGSERLRLELPHHQEARSLPIARFYWPRGRPWAVRHRSTGRRGPEGIAPTTTAGPTVARAGPTRCSPTSGGPSTGSAATPVGSTAPRARSSSPSCATPTRPPPPFLAACAELGMHRLGELNEPDNTGFAPTAVT